MLPNLDDLRYFLEVAQTGNISRAARRLAISQPALSVALKRLEDSLDARLLDRSNSGVRLTDSGHLVLERAHLLINDWQRLYEETTRLGTDVKGFFTFGAHPSVAQFTFPHFLTKLLNSFPELNIKIRHEDLSRKVLDALLARQIDYGFVVNPIRNPELVIKRLFNDKVHLWIRKDADISSTLKLKKQTLICNPDMIQSQHIISEAQKKSLSFDRVLASSSLELVASLAVGGAGVAILPSRVLNASQRSELKIVEPSLFYQDEICLLFRPMTSNAHRKIVGAIEEALLEADVPEITGSFVRPSKEVARHQ